MAYCISLFNQAIWTLVLISLVEKEAPQLNSVDLSSSALHWKPLQHSPKLDGGGWTELFHASTTCEIRKRSGGGRRYWGRWGRCMISSYTLLGYIPKLSGTVSYYRQRQVCHEEKWMTAVPVVLAGHGWPWAVTLPVPLALEALGNVSTENQAGLCLPPVSTEGCILRRSSTACCPRPGSGSPDRQLVQLGRLHLCISPKEHHKLFPTYQREFIIFFYTDFQLLPRASLNNPSLSDADAFQLIKLWTRPWAGCKSVLLVNANLHLLRVSLSSPFSRIIWHVFYLSSQFSLPFPLPGPQATRFALNSLEVYRISCLFAM